MNYEFIEIGTSNFRTLIETATDDTVGISIEPIKDYLDQLPSKPKVQKLNLAISPDNTFGNGAIYYIPENIIKEKNLQRWMKGSNRLDCYHNNHKGLEKFVKKDIIKKVPLYHIFDKYNVERLNCLKIDTEGCDCDILISFYDFLKNKKSTNYPIKIIFETNSLNSKNKIHEVLEKYLHLGYNIKEKTKQDTTLVYS